MARSAAFVWPLEFHLDGRFTNDKFCFVRHGQLALSWRRGPFGPDCRPATAEASAPEGSRPREWIMSQPHWTVTRSWISQPGAHRRWDKAYQLLLGVAGPSTTEGRAGV